jgi:predicted DNA-binding transcriptional regulator YafY
MNDTDTARAVRIRYTNHRGETFDRRVVPVAIRWGSDLWHPTPQWLMDAFDLDKRESRTFALRDVGRWQPGDRPANDARG